MNYQEVFNRTCVEYAKYLSKIDIPYLLAPGRSASYLVEKLQETGLSVPKLIPVDRRASFALSQLNDDSVMEILEPVMSMSPQGVIYFLEDYVETGAKLALISDNLRLFHGLNCSFEVMVATRNNVGTNAKVFEVNPNLVRWLSAKFKS